MRRSEGNRLSDFFCNLHARDRWAWLLACGAESVVLLLVSGCLAVASRFVVATGISVGIQGCERDSVGAQEDAVCLPGQVGDHNRGTGDRIGNLEALVEQADTAVTAHAPGLLHGKEHVYVLRRRDLSEIRPRIAQLALQR